MNKKQNTNDVPIPGRSCMKITHRGELLWKKSLN